jgi:phosphopantothenoylcysteine decarboxylase/phosphopantothenate--cysteine ligase
MGVALAEEAARRGAAVTLVAANVALPEPAGVERIDVETAAQLADVLHTEFGRADVLVMAAAPADFRPRSAAGEKIHREGAGIELDLEPTEDILAALASVRRDDQTVVGFAAETPSAASSASRPGAAWGVERAREKLERKGADAIVLNDVSRSEIGFESADNEVVIVERGGEQHVPLASKAEVAGAILDRVQALRGAARKTRG